MFGHTIVVRTDGESVTIQETGPKGGRLGVVLLSYDEWEQLKQTTDEQIAAFKGRYDENRRDVQS